MQRKNAKKPAPARTRAKKKTPPASGKLAGLKRLLSCEEKPDLTEPEAGSTTRLAILSPTPVGTQCRE